MAQAGQLEPELVRALRETKAELAVYLGGDLETTPTGSTYLAGSLAAAIKDAGGPTPAIAIVPFLTFRLLCRDLQIIDHERHDIMKILCRKLRSPIAEGYFGARCESHVARTLCQHSVGLGFKYDEPGFPDFHYPSGIGIECTTANPGKNSRSQPATRLRRSITRKVARSYHSPETALMVDATTALALTAQTNRPFLDRPAIDREIAKTGQDFGSVIVEFMLFETPVPAIRRVYFRFDSGQINSRLKDLLDVIYPKDPFELSDFEPSWNL